MAKKISQVISDLEAAPDAAEAFEQAIAFLNSPNAVQTSFDDAKRFLVVVDEQLKTQNPHFFKAAISTARSVSYGFEVASNHHIPSPEPVEELVAIIDKDNTPIHGQVRHRRALQANKSLPEAKQAFEQFDLEEVHSIPYLQKIKTARGGFAIRDAINSVMVESEIEDKYASAFLKAIDQACHQSNPEVSLKDKLLLLEMVIDNSSIHDALYELAHDHIHALTPNEGPTPDIAEYGTSVTKPKLDGPNPA